MELNKQVVIHNQTIPVTYTSSIQSIPYQNIVWGRKRSQVQMSGEEILKKEDSLSQDVTKMNQMILLCDDLLKMFDELILPAARLLDTVETKIQDFHLIQTERQNPFIPSSSKRKRTKPTKYFHTSPIIIKTDESRRLSEYSYPTFLERDRIEWNENEQYKQHQKHQAEEEAETDDEMIEYGVKIASKTVRTATKAFVARDWSLLSRMKYYKLSVKKLQAVNRKRGR